MAHKILIGPSSFAAIDKTPLNQLAEAGYEVVDNPYKRKLTKKELLELLDDKVIGLIAGLEVIDREVLEKTRLQVVSRVGAGISNVDLDAARDMGIKVFNTPDTPTEAVAELTIGSMLSLLRMIPQMNHALHEGQWHKKIGLQLQGKTVAIIGFGRIGKRVAKMLEPFSVKILVVDPFAEETAVSGYRLVTISEALAEADVVTIHSSGHDCIIGEEEFSLIKRGIYLLNVARGGVVSETCLVKAIEDGTVSGAWLDTFDEEPYSGPLCNYPNVILTPHVGSYTAECRSQMETEAVDNLLHYLKVCGDGKL